MSKSINRVKRHSETVGLSIDIRRMGESTRTAQEAANQCGCEVDQIVKSLIFQGESSGELYLFLVRGSKRLDLGLAADATREPLARADVRHVREVTGFAIGGVSPLGHVNPIKSFADEGLLAYKTVWAAAGAHDAVFESEPARLFAATNAKIGRFVDEPSEIPIKRPFTGAIE